MKLILVTTLIVYIVSCSVHTGRAAKPNWPRPEGSRRTPDPDEKLFREMDVGHDNYIDAIDVAAYYTKYPVNAKLRQKLLDEMGIAGGRGIDLTTFKSLREEMDKK